MDESFVSNRNRKGDRTPRKGGGGGRENEQQDLNLTPLPVCARSVSLCGATSCFTRCELYSNEGVSTLSAGHNTVCLVPIKPMHFIGPFMVLPTYIGIHNLCFYFIAICTFT